MGEANSYLLTGINLIQMPLFMAISGYVCKYESFKLLPKLKLLIPFFVIGMFFFAFILHGQTPIEFLAKPMKDGYWFFWVLFVFFVLLYLIRTARLNLYLGGIITWGVLVVIGHYMLPEWKDYLSWDKIEELWLFFLWGLILKHIDFEKRLVHKSIIYLIPLLILILVIVNDNITRIPGYGWFINFSLFVFLVVLFHDLENRFKGKTSKLKSITKKMGTDIGTNTLQIYSLHYIFLGFTNPPTLGNFLLEHNLLWTEFILSPILSIILSYICIYTAKLLYKLHLGFVFGR